MTYRFVPRYVKDIVPYQPGKPIEEVEREFGIPNSVKIASNENPLGVSPRAVKAVRRTLKGLNRYPDGSGFYLKNRLSAIHGTRPESIVLGNGSSELIELAIRTFMRPGDEAIISDPSFLIYSITVKASGGKPVIVKLLDDCSYDIDGIRNAVSSRTRLIFISNPNNPTGTIVPRKDYERLIKGTPGHVIVVDDAAYREFVRSDDYPDGIDYLKRKERNLVALRTFSKLYGLAGLRIGYGVTTPELAGYLERVRQPFNVNSLAQTAALAALDDRAFIEKTLKNNREGLDFLYGALDRMGVRFMPTQANFFLIKVAPSMTAKQAFAALLKRGVIVRDMTSYGLESYIRINVGTPYENRKFVRELKGIMQR
ncbi:MAG: histidinol-phosphate transaminase [Deltaproteobacteria bacterium]|nr:histidinol-phosphate transaminase [Deltaproteobacteria bacterium]MCL5276484.1 histidinol-phosphate transaminase [Deltaproteobacteria bacterium]